jgi:DtxR family transcriptional regulator, Mn-dependent transcriptional regulator
MDIIMKDVWKKFEQTELTHSSIHHLLAINSLSKEYGYSRSVDIANYLNISRASVSITTTKLKEKGFIRVEKNRFLSLSKKGKDLVNSVLSKRRIVEIFFKEVLDLPSQEAEIEACKVEHLLSEPTGKKLISFMGYFLSEQPDVVKFREGLESFNYVCEAIRDCNVCEMDCIFRENGQRIF